MTSHRHHGGPARPQTGATRRQPRRQATRKIIGVRAVSPLLAAPAPSDLRIKRLAQALSKPSQFVLYLGLIRAGVSQLVIIVRFSLLALLPVLLLGRSGLRQF